MKKIIISLLLVILMVFNNNIKAKVTKGEMGYSSDKETKKFQEALVNSAFAYYYRGEAIQYDSSELNFQDRKNRNGGCTKSGCSSDMFFSPEMATSQDYKYTVCSSFTENVLYETVKKNGSGYLFKNKQGEIITKTHGKIGLIDIGDRTNYNYDNDLQVFYAYNLYQKDDRNKRFKEYFLSDQDKMFYYTEKGTKKTLDIGYDGKYTDTVRTNIYKAKQKIYNQMLNVLEPGDIIILEYILNQKIGGHALLYVGNGRIMDSGGTIKVESEDREQAKYNFKKKTDGIEKSGTIHFRELKYLDDNFTEKQYFATKEKEYDDYIKNKDKYIYPKALLGGSINRITIIRPAKKIVKQNSSNKNNATKQWTLSENVKNREPYPRLSFTKTSNVEKYESVTPGTVIEYKITIENHHSKDDYVNIEVNDLIPSNTTFVSMTTKYSGKNVNGKLSWNVNVNHKKTIALSYKVKVNDSVSMGTYIVSDGTTVNNIKLNTIRTLVSYSFDENNFDKNIKSIVGEKLSSQKFLNAVYKGYNFDSVNDIINSLFQVKSLTNSGYDSKFVVPNKKNILQYKLNADVNNKYMKMYVKGLFGGVFTSAEKNYSFLDGRVLTIKDVESNKTVFSKGDILIVVNSNYKAEKSSLGTYNKHNVFIYSGDKEHIFYTLDGDNKVIKLSKSKSIRLMDSLLGHDCFIVLRPSKVNSTSLTTETPQQEIPEQGSHQQNVAVTKITLDKTTATMKVGETLTLKKTITPSNATDASVTWSTNKKKVATVDEKGNVKALGPGVVKITVKSNSNKKKTATCKITIKEDEESKAISITPQKIVMLKGTKESLKYDTSIKGIKFTSSSTSLATVNRKGVITAKGSGTAIITAKATVKEGNKKITMIGTSEVTVVDYSITFVDCNTKEEICKNNRYDIKIDEGKEETAKLCYKYTLEDKKGVLTNDEKRNFQSKLDSMAVYWKTKNKKIVDVSQKGVLTAKKDGSSVITFKTANGKNKTCKVYVSYK